MSIPQSVLNRVYQHYSETNWCTITLDSHNCITQTNQAARDQWPLLSAENDVRTVIPILATENLNEDFHIPFYNHDTEVYDLHFMILGQNKIIIMVPINKLHQQIQHKQQIAHDQTIEKLRIKYLFSTLEGAHAELKEANQAKSFYISALSHEIGNPLNVIKGYNKLLSKGSVGTKKATQIIDRNVNKLEQIINQSIDYDREQTRQFTALFKPFELINDQFNDFRLQAKAKGLKLMNHVDDSMVLASSKTKWNQILTNLISNAIKYTDSGQITVTSTTEGDQLHIDVSDTGTGMSEAFQQQLFTAWSREQKSQAQGNGIGLVISKMLAEQINANLTLQSSSPEGSVFRFSSEYSMPQQSLKVLLVDDDVDCLNLFHHYLTQAGHHTKTANSIKNLKHQISNHEFDVLITDLNLTDGQSYEVCAELKDVVKQIIVMTASPTPEVFKSLKDIGIKHILAKPLTQEQLVSSITS